MRDKAKEALYEILLKRGVFKWLAVRRDLITYKNTLKREIFQFNHEVENGSLPRRIKVKGGCKFRLSFGKFLMEPLWIDNPEYLERKGRIKALIEVRKEIRKMCHSHRWRVQENDREASLWMDAKATNWRDPNAKTLFPIKVRFTDNDHERVVLKPDDLPNARDFRVLKTNVK